MSLLYEKGTTIAGIVLAAVFGVFVVPFIAYSLLLVASSASSVAVELCARSLPPDSPTTCTVTEKVYDTTYGRVSVRLVTVTGGGGVAMMLNTAVAMLATMLSIMARAEVLVASFAVDLIVYAYEQS